MMQVRTRTTGDEHRCETCPLRPRCLPADLPLDRSRAFEQHVCKSAIFGRGNRLFHAGDARPPLCVIRSGSFKTVRILDNGEEHVVGLHLRGEVLCIDGLLGKRHAVDAIALEPGGACAVHNGALHEQIYGDPAVAKRLVEMLAQRVASDLEYQILMASFRAEERVARFLLYLGDRLEAAGLLGHSFWCPLPRKDLANHLGLRLPTVSRVFSGFRRDGILRVEGRLITIADRDRLRAAARLTDAFDFPRLPRPRHSAQGPLAAPGSIAAPRKPAPIV